MMNLSLSATYIFLRSSAIPIRFSSRLSGMFPRVLRDNESKSRRRSAVLTKANFARMHSRLPSPVCDGNRHAKLFFITRSSNPIGSGQNAFISMQTLFRFNAVLHRSPLNAPSWRRRGAPSQSKYRCVFGECRGSGAGSRSCRAVRLHDHCLIHKDCPLKRQHREGGCKKP